MLFSLLSFLLLSRTFSEQLLQFPPTLYIQTIVCERVWFQGPFCAADRIPLNVFRVSSDNCFISNGKKQQSQASSHCHLGTLIKEALQKGFCISLSNLLLKQVIIMAKRGLFPKTVESSMFFIKRAAQRRSHIFTQNQHQTRLLKNDQSPLCQQCSLVPLTSCSG